MKLKKTTDNRMRSFGETDFRKGVAKVNKKLSKTRTLSGAKKKDTYPGVLDSEIHENLHIKHPKMTEKATYKKTKVLVKKMSKKQKQKIYSQYK